MEKALKCQRKMLLALRQGWRVEIHPFIRGINENQISSTDLILPWINKPQKCSSRGETIPLEREQPKDSFG